VSAATTENSATVGITDDDDPPLLGTPVAQFGSAAYMAGEALGSRTASVAVSLSPAPSGTVTVAYTVSGTATSVDDFAALCARERCPWAPIGEATRERRLEVHDARFDAAPVSMPMEVLLGDLPRMRRDAVRVPPAAGTFDTGDLDVGALGQNREVHELADRPRADHPDPHLAAVALLHAVSLPVRS